MPTFTAVLGDLTEQAVDAIVNPANRAVRRGLHGVNGAVHRRGGPAVEKECIERFPDGLAIGDAGATTAGDLPARWVIHTVGPDRGAGHHDRSQLESCYRRALEVADEIGARSIAFPLLGAGAHGWSRSDAIAAAFDTFATTTTGVDEVRIVSPDTGVHSDVGMAILVATPIRILQGVRVLHQRGYDRIRIRPGMSPTGLYWRVGISVEGGHDLVYSSSTHTAFADGQVTVSTSPETVAQLILDALPPIVPTRDDPTYMAWYAGLIALVERMGSPPIAYEEYFDDSAGWKIDGVDDIRYPHPPAPLGAR